ncbi:MAG: hypothetical protein HY323_05370 [Betaproteobacteria bacterium]|nr:hypothetical protein [Betaproteobacteria bacterium]
MSVHVFHPDTHTAGLQDGCERCREHADAPWLSLDEHNLRALIERLRDGKPARSETEAIALVNIENTISRAGKLVRVVGPDALWGPDGIWRTGDS